MCRDHIHKCAYCGKNYECFDPNWICPTLNFDEDKNLCPDCRKRLEESLRKDNND